jgi:glycosyltransferase involved in cell wall biosynthesis
MVERQNKVTVRVEDGGLSNQPIVEVLLATYNGERFLREQIDSILKQDYVNLHVLARDDGSNDETVNILNEYANRFSDRFRVMPPTPPTGSAKENFLLLMRASSAEYICFADQDDIWLPDKVTRTMQAMNRLESRWGSNISLLVFTDLRVVDNQLRTLHESYWSHEGINPEHIDRTALLLSKNVVTGCTSMINRRLLELSSVMPTRVSMHDRWVGLLASTMGKSAMVKSPTILYRQHSGNVVGITKRKKTFGEHLSRFGRESSREKEWQISQQQAKALLETYGDRLPVDKRNLVEAYLRCGADRRRFVRILTMFSYGFYRTGVIRNLATMVDLWRLKPGFHGESLSKSPTKPNLQS